MRVVGLYGPGPGWDHAKPLWEQQGIRDHVGFLTDLGERGVLTRAGPFHGRSDLVADQPVGLIVFADADVDEARALVARDPAVERGTMTCTVLPWYA